jgi:hypothetical protein
VDPSLAGSLYRPTGYNINGLNIRAPQINCSIHQRKLVDVKSIILTNMLLRSTAPQLHTSVQRRKTERKGTYPKSKFIRICLKENLQKTKKTFIVFLFFSSS